MKDFKLLNFLVKHNLNIFFYLYVEYIIRDYILYNPNELNKLFEISVNNNNNKLSGYIFKYINNCTTNVYQTIRNHAYKSDNLKILIYLENKSKFLRYDYVHIYDIFYDDSINIFKYLIENNKINIKSIHNYFYHEYLYVPDLLKRKLCFEYLLNNNLIDVNKIQSCDLKKHILNIQNNIRINKLKKIS